MPALAIDADGLDYTGHSELSARLVRELVSNSYECMVCMDLIKPHTALSSCSRCHAMFHIFCIKKWASSDTSGPGWRCPGCQKENQSTSFAYTCFCGKVRDPEFNPYITPHSCGDVCAKLRTGTPCPHPCTLPCHPGPCPPCPLSAPERSCFCGATSYVAKCSDVDTGRSCGDSCAALLPCGRHECAEVCHAGPCPPCDVSFEQSCYCGKGSAVRKCQDAVFPPDSEGVPGSDPSFSCQDVCGATLACGNHTCARICHMGPCPPCPLTPDLVSSCHCGKTPFAPEARTSCTDPVPACELPCGRTLGCGQHACDRPCHPGPCPPCTTPINARCRCGSREGTALCGAVNTDPVAQATQVELSLPDIRTLDGEPLEAYTQDPEDRAVLESVKPFTCARKCKIRLHCGRHKCGVKCCPVDPITRIDPEGLHICRQACGRRLDCGIHQCQRGCHNGRCGECLQVSFDELVCPCGSTRMLPPIPCGTTLPDCPQPCSIQRECGHPVSHPCHPEGSPCSRCVVLVPKLCNGGHRTLPHVRCYQVDVSCGAVCGKPMICGQHTCTRTCHLGPCVVETPKAEAGAAASSSASSSSAAVAASSTDLLYTSDDDADDVPPTCHQKCLRMRSSCSHRCQALCHPNQPCPPLVCQERVFVTCACGRNRQEVMCSRGGPVESENSIIRSLPCDEACAMMARNARLAAALGPSARGAAHTAVEYSEFLQVAVVRDADLIALLEKDFAKLLSSSAHMSSTLIPMRASDREIAHSLAVVYHLDSESYDDEPYRRVVVTKRPDSRIPPVLLSEWQSVVRMTRKMERERIADARDIGVEADPEEKIVPEDMNAIHVFGLEPAIKTRHLLNFFRPFENEYRLQWIDDANALAIFASYIRALQAFNLLSDKQFGIRLTAVPVSGAPSSSSSGVTSATTVLGRGGLSGSARRKKKLSTFSAARQSALDEKKEKSGPKKVSNPFELLNRTDLVRAAMSSSSSSDSDSGDGDGVGVGPDAADESAAEDEPAADE